jgi:hypothetical protein
LRHGLEIMESACAPASASDVAKWLIALRLETRSRSEGIDLEAQTRLYVAKLREWPGDVVATILPRWSNDHDFWPTWQELHHTLNVLAGERLMLRDAIRSAVTLDRAVTESAQGL